MNGNIKLIQNNDGSYDMLLDYSIEEAEFALEFLEKDRLSNNYQSMREWINQNAKSIKINMVKIMIAGTILAAIPFSSFLSAGAAGGEKFSMAYLYGGTPEQQISYVNRTNSSLQTVSPSYFDLNADGSLKLNPVSKELVNRMHADGIKVVPFLSNHWDRPSGIAALNNADALTSQIAAAVSSYNLDGVNVDIENVTEQQRGAYTEFVRLLRQKIPAHKEISVAVAANPNNWGTGWQGSYDYEGLAKHADYLMIMSYDEHFEGSSAGPVASLQFVENSIKYALGKTTADKIVIGLPMYGRIWSLDNTSFLGKGAGINVVNSMINDYNASITYDTLTQSPRAEFEVKSGDKLYTVSGKTMAPGRYVIWYENDRSLEAKLNLVKKYDLKGAGSWSLGQEDASIWQSYSTWLNGAAPVSPATPAASTATKTSEASKSGTAGSKSTGTAGAVSKQSSSQAAGVSSAAQQKQSAAIGAAAVGGTTGSSSPAQTAENTGGVSEIFAAGNTELSVDDSYELAAGETAVLAAEAQTAEDTELLASPSEKGKVLSVLAAGTAVLILGAAGVFIKVKYKGLVGYIKERKLRVGSAK